ncbi:hypothetical protein O3P69_016494 [Scylla paramamosain]|uniref:Uncharacterized protein n=1 Tax=Scylla paramamosain TaxID=85552 RepID=A0AAW0TER0_SCYPA
MYHTDCSTRRKKSNRHKEWRDRDRGSVRLVCVWPWPAAMQRWMGKGVKDGEAQNIQDVPFLQSSEQHQQHWIGVAQHIWESAAELNRKELVYHSFPTIPVH